MSYYKKEIWKIIPAESPPVIRNCKKCGCKMPHVNTGNFRVNANGGRLDVWLIYQCPKCKNTYNLTVYERVSPARIPPGEYEKYLSNDRELAKRQGCSMEILRKNRAEADYGNVYIEIVKEQEPLQSPCMPEKKPKFMTARINIKEAEGEREILVINEYGIKADVEKVLAQGLEISRSKIKKLVNSGILCYTY